MDFLMTVAVRSGIGYLPAVYFASRWISRPTPGGPHRTPDELGLSWESVECRTDDGLRLAGWVVEPARAHATMVLCHGMRLNRDSLLARIAILTAAGYRCVAFDHRGHGASTGRYTSFGFHERR